VNLGRSQRTTRSGMVQSGSARSCRQMSEDQLRKIFAEGKPDWLEEGATEALDAADVVARLDVQTFFDLLKVPYPTDRAGVLDRLLADRLIDELSGGRYRIRRLGAIILAKRLSDFLNWVGRLLASSCTRARRSLRRGSTRRAPEGTRLAFRGWSNSSWSSSLKTSDR
jgi:hypothetical protein